MESSANSGKFWNNQKNLDRMIRPLCAAVAAAVTSLLSPSATERSRRRNRSPALSMAIAAIVNGELLPTRSWRGALFDLANACSGRTNYHGEELDKQIQGWSREVEALQDLIDRSSSSNLPQGKMRVAGHSWMRGVNAIIRDVCFGGERTNTFIKKLQSQELFALTEFKKTRDGKIIVEACEART